MKRPHHSNTNKLQISINYDLPLMIVDSRSIILKYLRVNLALRNTVE